MIFAHIVDEANSASSNITSVFTKAANKVNAIFQTKDGISLSENFKYDPKFLTTLKNDEDALLKYSSALKDSNDPADIFATTMSKASDHAKAFAQEGNVCTETIAQFTTKQKTMAQVTAQAASGGLGNIRSILNEYNSALKENSDGLTTCGLTQNEFTGAVGESKKVIGGYLGSLNGAEASLIGYIRYASKAIVKTVALSVVIANVGKAISDLISLVSKAGGKSETLGEKFDNISSELSDVNSELSGFKSELSNVEGQIDKLLEKDELSFTDKEELARLRSVSTELKSQIKLAETLQDSLKRSLSGTAIGAYGEYAQNTSFYSKETKAARKEDAKEMGTSIGNAAGLVIGGAIGLALGNPLFGAAIGSTVGSFGGSLVGGAISDASYDSEATVGEMIDNMRLERAKLEMAQKEAYEAYTKNNSSSNKENWQEATQALNDYNTALANHINQLSSYYNAIDYNALTDTQKQEYIKIGDDLDTYNIQMGVSGAKTVALDRIFSDKLITDEAKELKKTVQSALNSGEEIHFYDLKVDQFKGTIDRLQEMGISLEVVIDYFNDLKIAKEEALDYDTYDMVEGVAALSEGVGELVDAFKEFNEE